MFLRPWQNALLRPFFSKEGNMEQRVVTFLNRSEVDFLDKLGKDALFSTGIKLSRAKLIAWLIYFLEKLRLNGKGIKSEQDLENKITEALKIQAKKGE